MCSSLAGGQQNRAPNELQMNPKSTPKTSQRTQMSLRSAAGFQIQFSTEFEPFGIPKTSQEAPKIIQNRPPRPRAAQRPPGTPPEASREPFWHHFGPPEAHFRAFQASFSKLARAPPHDRKHSSKSLPKGSFATAAGPMRTTPQAQWSVWGRRPTGDPATEPFRLTWGRERSEMSIPKAL